MKQKKKIFWKVYWIVVAIAVLLVAVVLVVLHNFLGAYEKAQPVHKMDEILQVFQEGNVEELLSYETTSFDSQYADDIRMDFVSRTEGKELTYTIKYGAYSDEAPVYTVYADKEKLAEVYLKADEKSASFHSKIWNLDKIGGLVQKKDDIEVIAPSNYIVSVNGEKVTDAPEVSAEIEDKENYGDIISDFPMENTYHIGNIYRTPEVSCMTPDGVEVPLSSQEDQTFRFEILQNQEMPQDRMDGLKDFIGRYTKFCMNDAKLSDVLNDFLVGTDTYNRMLVMDEVNIYSGSHSSLDISEPTVSDYVVYNENAYSVKAEYTYTLRLGDRVRENPTVLHVYYGKVNGEWKIVKMLINRNDKR